MSDRDAYFMREAGQVALYSPDLSTQNGAVLVNDAGRYIESGVNRAPSGVAHRLKRPEKYVYTEHAEREALFMAARYGLYTEGSTLYAVWAACNDCARAIIGCGVSRVVTHAHHRAHPLPRWDLSAADAMLAEAGVQLEVVDLPLGVDLRFGGEVVSL